MLGRPGSKPCTTSKRPVVSARRRFARTATGTPMFVRRERGMDGPTAITSSSVPRCSALRPATRSRVREEGARMVTSCPIPRRASAAPATCAFTSCGCDHAKGVTKQIRRLTRCKLTCGRGRGHDQGESERAVQGGGAGTRDRLRGQRVRDSAGPGDRAVPVRALADEAVLRQVASPCRVRRRRLCSACQSVGPAVPTSAARTTVPAAPIQKIRASGFPSRLCASLGLHRVLDDEALDVLARLVVADLLRRRLHEVRARRLERA